MESSIGHLMKVAKDFYFILIRINQINDGVRNTKRFKITILHVIYLIIFSLILNLFSI